MSFLFVDRILSLESGKTTTGTKFVSHEDRYLTRNTAGDVVLMPSIMAETVGQLCAWNVMQHFDFKLRPVAGMCQRVEILGDAKLGDCLQLSATIESLEHDTVHYNATVAVDDKPVLRLIDAVGPMLPMEDFIDRDTVQRQFESINRPGEFNPSPQAMQRLHDDVQAIPGLASYDQIIEWQDESVIASKNINGQAPYFADHFPHKPVFPLTLLMNAHIELAQQWLAQHNKRFNKLTLSKIKMGRFVSPGDCLTTTMTVKENQADRVCFVFRSVVDGHRVAVVKVEYHHD